MTWTFSFLNLRNENNILFLKIDYHTYKKTSLPDEDVLFINTTSGGGLWSARHCLLMNDLNFLSEAIGNWKCRNGRTN